MRYYIFKVPFNSPNWNREFKEVNFGDYVPVWTGTTETEDFVLETDDDFELLERLFEKFNIRIPEHYAASSLSVGDIIGLQKNPSIARDQLEYYMCCGIGWEKVKVKVC